MGARTVMADLQSVTTIFRKHNSKIVFWSCAFEMRVIHVYMRVSDFPIHYIYAFTHFSYSYYKCFLFAVFNSVLKRISKGSHFSQANQPYMIVTLFQFMFAILDSKCKSLHFFVHEVASECKFKLTLTLCTFAFYIWLMVWFK